MPRTARIVVPNYPQHIVQRGHNGQTVFTCDDERRYYLANLRDKKEELDCKVYAFCLMSNHVHLIVDPGEKSEAMAILMKHVAGRQTRFVNAREGRRGTLWEGRYKSSLIDVDRYLLACCRYVELNPVRSGMVKVPEQYCWSSYRHKIGLDTIEWLDEDPIYKTFGKTDNSRRERYRKWIMKVVPPEDHDLIRQALQRGQLTGQQAFVDKVYDLTGLFVDPRGQGRPPKNKSVPFL